uniref:Immunoglobulin domain-containing protein n=1 Tax=Sinocyclocheilus anshuiensis TaxID=1608454 RepID=A0A671NZI3_9TELE
MLGPLKGSFLLLFFLVIIYSSKAHLNALDKLFCLQAVFFSCTYYNAGLFWLQCYAEIILGFFLLTFKLKYNINIICIMFSGCDLVENRKTAVVTGYSGESVVLPCSCTELQAKPEHIQVKLFNPNTPGNLSLHISALTTEDQGHYQCFVSSQQVVAVRLRVLHVEGKKTCVHPINLTTDQPSHQTQDSTTSQLKLIPQHHTPQCNHFCFSTSVFILLGVFFSVLLLALLAFTCWRCRGSRIAEKVTTDGEELKREQDNQDDVMYSAVVHVKTASTPAHTHSDSAELTEYACINVKCY